MPMQVIIAALIVMALCAPARAQQLPHCKADAQRLCHGVQPGGGRIAQCLKAQQDQVSVGCAKELQALKARHQQGQ